MQAIFVGRLETDGSNGAPMEYILAHKAQGEYRFLPAFNLDNDSAGPEEFRQILARLEMQVTGDLRVTEVGEEGGCRKCIISFKFANVNPYLVVLDELSEEDRFIAENYR